MKGGTACLALATGIQILLMVASQKSDLYAYDYHRHGGRDSAEEMEHKGRSIEAMLIGSLALYGIGFILSAVDGDFIALNILAAFAGLIGALCDIAAMALIQNMTKEKTHREDNWSFYVMYDLAGFTMATLLGISGAILMFLRSCMHMYTDRAKVDTSV